MDGWDRWGVVDLYKGVGGGTGGRYHLIVNLFFSCFCILVSHILNPFI